MIRLAGNEVRMFESQVYEHPEQTGSSYVAYNIAHNLGGAPDITKAYQSLGGVWHELPDFYTNGSTSYSQLVAEFPSLNEVTIYLFRTGSGTKSVKFRLFKTF